MAFAAVISASATLSHDDGALRATLVLAGQTLVEFQARQAAQAGAGHISIHVGAITPALSRSVDRLAHDGIAVSLVRSAAELRQTVPPDTDILLIGDGIIADQHWYREMALHPAPVLLVANERISDPPFERIDARHRWAGLARLDFRQLSDTLDTLDMLADWDLQSTLLRHAVQAGPSRVEVPDEALFEGGVLLVTTQVGADAAEKRVLPPRAADEGGEGLVERHVLGPLARRLAPVLLRQQVEPGHLRLGAVAAAALALLVAANGTTWPALLIFLAALGGEATGAAMARIARRTDDGGWRGNACLALALLGVVLLGNHWTYYGLGHAFAGFHLAAALLIVELAVRRGKAAGLPGWALCSLGTALALLLGFRLAGFLDLGFALVLLHALATLGLLILGKRGTADRETAGGS